MPRFCANLSMMFNEVPFLMRFEAAAKAGFHGVEFLFPYEHPAAELRARLDDNGLTQVLFNAPPGNWTGGERGTATLPGRQQEFRDGILQALSYAEALGNKLVHVMAGIPPGTLRPGTAAALYASNLSWAIEQAAPRGIKLIIEPINHRDMPGFFLNTTGQGASYVEAFGPERLGLQFDLYHCQVTEGDVTTRMAALLPLIAHLQIADVPGRHEPGTGEIGWPFVFGEIDRLGYGGWVGCEYRPAGDTVSGLDWRRKYRQ